MSRAGFSIRKLINQRQTWPDSDDETDGAFECSSAKTIRVQYELEQYQQQQLLKDGRHQTKDRASWTNSSGPTKKSAPRRAPKPITITRHASDELLLKSGNASAGRRISSPVPVSSLAARITPRTPLCSRSSEESLEGVYGTDYNQAQSQHLSVPRRAASSRVNHHSPRGATPITHAPPTTAKCSYEQPSFHNDKFISLSGACMSTSPQPAYATNPNEEAYIKTPVVTPNRPIKTVIKNAPEYQRSDQTYTPQYPEFANGVPSPPLDPEEEEAEGENVQGPRGPSMGQPMTKPARHTETTWFLGDGDEDAVPESVQQLIWETDAAFKAVSAALAEANQVSGSHSQAKELQAQLRHLQHTSKALHTQTHGTKKPVLPSIPTPTQTYPSVRDLVSPISPTSGRGTVASRKSASPLSPSPNILRSPTRGTSISKTKRAPKSPGRPKTPRSALLDSSPSKAVPSGPSSKGLNGQRHQHSYHRSLSKFNLAADNVTEKLFSGRFGLHRIEADELVTPSTVEQFRQARLAREGVEAEAEAEARRSASSEMQRSIEPSMSYGDSSSAATTNVTPVELFQLQGSPSHMGLSGVDATANVLSPVVKVPTPRPFGLNKDNRQQAPFMTGPADITKGLEQGHSLIVTPPPTPPQIFSRAAPDHNSGATSSQAFSIPDQDESMRSFTLGLQRLLPSKPSRKPTHTRANSSSSRIPLLPTIPEVKITSPGQPSEASPQLQLQLQGHNTPEQAEAGSQQEPGAQATRAGSPFFREDDDHMWLVSPAYTENMPTIRHGPIRLAKDDLVNHGAINSIEAKLMSTPDETMDWIAFQMAILGGAGDLYSNPDDFLTRDAQEDLVDDLCDWFEGFGFSSNGLGCLLTKEDKPKATGISLTPPSSSKPRASPRTPPSARTPRPQPKHKVVHSSQSTRGPENGAGVTEEGEGSDQNMPIPVTTEHPSGFWNTQPFDASRFHTGSSCGIKRWTLEGHPKRYQGPGIDVEKANTLSADSDGTKTGSSPKPMHSAKFAQRSRRGIRESVDSLPQSPMLELVMTTAVDGSKDFVPMGYNLGHDLGDFLKWESEHVVAPGYYGAD